MFKLPRLIFLISVIMLLFAVELVMGCRSTSNEEPVIILTNSKGQKTMEFDVMDIVAGSFCRLRPDKRYDVRIMRSDGREISYSSFRSNRNGIISSSVLWWDIGVEYSDSRMGRLDLETPGNYKYSCELVCDKKPIAELQFRLRPIREAGAIIFSSDGKGNPLNGFLHEKEDVFATGKNFPPGSTVHIYVVQDRHSYESGGLISDRTKPIIMQLDNRQRDFTTQIITADRTKIGAYDLIVEYKHPDNFISYSDLIDSEFGVGFTVFKDGLPSPAHVEAELACQAPPQDQITGAVIGAPNPYYKDYFAEDEQVWVAVNPVAGGTNYSGQNARLYVVNHKTQTEWGNNNTLNDVSGGYETTVIQPGCANVNYTKVWDMAAIRDDGYDVIVDFPPFGSYDVGIDIIDKLDAKGFVVPSGWICLDSISFNYDSSSTNSDAINIRKNYTENVDVPEWKKTEKTQPAVYIKSKIVNINVVFSASTSVQTAEIGGTLIAGLMGDVNKQTVNFSGSGTKTVTFTLGNATPDSIKYFIQKWNWYYENVNSSGSPQSYFASTTNPICIILGQPQSPWTTSGQTEPWYEVFQKSCSWAMGETTFEGAAAQITHHLYNDCGGSYVYGPQYALGGTTGNFKLTLFLSNYPNIGLVNCYDMGKSQVIFSNVLGCTLTYKYKTPFGSLNCIKAVGKDWKCDEGFGNHGFGGIFKNNENYIFDACLKVDIDGDPANAPPGNASWLTDELWSSYRGKVMKDDYPQNPLDYSFSIF